MKKICKLQQEIILFLAKELLERDIMFPDRVKERIKGIETILNTRHMELNDMSSGNLLNAI